MRRAPSQRTKDYQAKMQSNHMKNELISEQQRVSEENVGLKAKVVELETEAVRWRSACDGWERAALEDRARVAELEAKFSDLEMEKNLYEERVSELEKYVERVDAQSVPLKNFYEDHQDEAFGVERVRELEADVARLEEEFREKVFNLEEAKSVIYEKLRRQYGLVEEMREHVRDYNEGAVQKPRPMSEAPKDECLRAWIGVWADIEWSDGGYWTRVYDEDELQVYPNCWREERDPPEAGEVG